MRLDDYLVVCASKYKVRDVNVLKLFINTEDIKKRPTHFMNCTPERENTPLRKKFIIKQLTTWDFLKTKNFRYREYRKFFCGFKYYFLAFSCLQILKTQKHKSSKIRAPNINLLNLQEMA